MVENTNCPNCGAPLEIENNKCSYCGTPYFDMSTVEIGGRPIILKIKNAEHMIISKVRLTNATLTHNTSYMDIFADNKILYREPVTQTEISLDFVSTDPICYKDE